MKKVSWKKPLSSGFQTVYKLQKEGIQRVLKYFYEHKVKDIFKNGSLSYGVEWDSIKIYYNGEVNTFLDFKIQLGDRRWSEEMRWLVQDFIIDLYFEYERDGRRMRNKDIALLFGISDEAMMMIINRIKKKMKKKYSYMLDK